MLNTPKKKKKHVGTLQYGRTHLRTKINFANKFPVAQQMLQVDMFTKPEACHYRFISQLTTDLVNSLDIR